jgi:hypothetical protein
VEAIRVIPVNPLLRYAAGAALIAYGTMAVITERSPTLLTPTLYTVALVLLGFVQQSPTANNTWLGIAICLLSTWSQPLLNRTLTPLLPQESFMYIIPSLITYALIVGGSVILGASFKDGGLLHRSSGPLLAIAAAASLFVGPFPYAVVLIWVGYQLVPRKPTTVGPIGRPPAP